MLGAYRGPNIVVLRRAAGVISYSPVLVRLFLILISFHAPAIVILRCTAVVMRCALGFVGYALDMIVLDTPAIVVLRSSVVVCWRCPVTVRCSLVLSGYLFVDDDSSLKMSNLLFDLSSTGDDLNA
jgi:hypothetical protein